jgi:DNA replicative helicase MCM subunit Mcm2 (Cdc46/Mcm family)
MKNISVLFFLIILFLSCNKKSDCYTCITKFDVTHRDSVESVSWSVSDTKERCDMTEEMIRKFENDNADTLVEISGTVTTTTIISTKCTN